MDDPLQLISNTVDQITTFLVDQAGIEVTLLHTQLLIFFLTLIVLAAMRKKWWPLSELNAAGAAMIAAPFFIAVAIALSWLGQTVNPPPEFIHGNVSNGSTAVRIKVLSGSQEDMTKRASIDDAGDFLVTYDFALSSYPRVIEIKRPDCETPVMVPVSLEQLRREHLFQIDNQC